MSRMAGVLGFIFGAKWFFPITFIVAMVFAVQLSSRFDERHAEKGDQPHSMFTVVWQPGAAGEPFGYSRLANLSQTQTPAQVRSFIMEKTSGRIEGGRRDRVAYQVISSSAAEQIIEVAYSNDTYSVWSRYRATRSAVTPVFSKLNEPGQMIKALPIALVFAAAIYVTGKWLRRRVARAKAKGEAASQGPSR